MLCWKGLPTLFLTVYCRNYSEYAPNQWEMALHCDAISHWLSTYSEWSDIIGSTQDCGNPIAYEYEKL